MVPKSETDREYGFLLSRAEKCALDAQDRYSVITMPFTDERTSGLLKADLGKMGADNFFFYGGYDDAERKMPVFFCSEIFSGDPEEILSEIPLRWIMISGDGYGTFSHRDCLGALLAAGIKRETLGDIVFPGASHEAPGTVQVKGGREICTAYVAVYDENGISGFIRDSVTRIGKCSVTVSVCAEDFRMELKRAYDTVCLPVSSLRIDCVAAEAAGMSRSDAKEAVERGFVLLNHESVTAPDKQIAPGDVFSVRGCGKFRFAGEDGVTRSGRKRIRLLKYK